MNDNFIYIQLNKIVMSAASRDFKDIYSVASVKKKWSTGNNFDE